MVSITFTRDTRSRIKRKSIEVWLNKESQKFNQSGPFGHSLSYVILIISYLRVLGG